ncbi:hypothetical protein KP509_02G114200 [Ceratopteris richardii]|uniref:Uncharacterized protein n=1 Tax=Ceratopteris richardii TaxID=49495 RepID=A0A8T2VD09_CERRI|nr:hypothetical protein KP509_02G114200 [Ceratopteris richardii]
MSRGVKEGHKATEMPRSTLTFFVFLSKHVDYSTVFSVLEALVGTRTTTSLSMLCEKHSTKFLSTDSLFNVSEPVLSLQRTSMPTSSSMAIVCLVIAPCCERTIGIAIGIPAIRSTKRLLIPSPVLYVVYCT